jgi:hypothetical protein
VRFKSPVELRNVAITTTPSGGVAMSQLQAAQQAELLEAQLNSPVLSKLLPTQMRKSRPK